MSPDSHADSLWDNETGSIDTSVTWWMQTCSVKHFEWTKKAQYKYSPVTASHPNLHMSATVKGCYYWGFLLMGTLNDGRKLDTTAGVKLESQVGRIKIWSRCEGNAILTMTFNAAIIMTVAMEFTINQEVFNIKSREGVDLLYLNRELVPQQEVLIAKCSTTHSILMLAASSFRHKALRWQNQNIFSFFGNVDVKMWVKAETLSRTSQLNSQTARSASGSSTKLSVRNDAAAV